MGCGCGKAKTPAERSATQKAAVDHQRAKRAGTVEPKRVWNGPARRKP